METEIKKGDIVVSLKMALDNNLSPFREVHGIQKFPEKGTYKLMLKHGRVPSFVNSTDYQLVTPSVIEKYENIKKRISIINSDSDNQHISSFDGKPKIGHVDEINAYKSAFRMALRDELTEWVIYKCKVCKEFHIGKNIINKED